MKKLLEYIDEHGVQALACDTLRIKVKGYPNNLWNLSYSQIDSLKYDEICDSCRGTIVRTDDNGKNPVIVARAFKRFYNLGENPNEEIPNGGLLAEEKLDGTMIIVYYDLGHWHVATKKMIYAEGDIMDSSMSFYELFCAVIGCSPDEMMEGEFPFLYDKTDVSFVFELTSLKNKVVTTYNSPSLTLLAAFNNTEHYEYSSYGIDLIVNKLQEGPAKRIRRVNQYTSLWDVGDVSGKIKTLDRTEEGFVCYVETSPGKRWRIKMKNPEYVKLHYAANGGAITRKRIMKLITDNEQAEFLAYFPEWSDDVQAVENAINSIIDACFDIYNSDVWNLEGKAFAMSVKYLDFSSLLFRMKNTDQSAEEVFLSMKLSYQLAMIETILPIKDQGRRTIE